MNDVVVAVLVALSVSLANIWVFVRLHKEFERVRSESLAETGRLSGLVDNLFHALMDRLEDKVTAGYAPVLLQEPLEGWHRYTKKIGLVSADELSETETFFRLIPDNLEREISVTLEHKGWEWRRDTARSKRELLRLIHAGDYMLLDEVTDEGLRIIDNLKGKRGAECMQK